MLEKLVYTEEECPQRSEIWEEIRKPFIGASETGAILGFLSKYEKPKTVWKRKTGKLKPKTANSSMLLGQKLEESAKILTKSFLKQEKLIINPKLDGYFAVHSKYQFLSASFDGVDVENKFITELKCPEFSRNFKFVFEQGLKDYYYAQVQQQLFIAKDHWNIEKAFFSSYYPNGTYVLDIDNFTEIFKTLAVREVKLNNSYCDAMLVVLKKFHENVEQDCWDDEEYNTLLQNFYDKIYL